MNWCLRTEEERGGLRHGIVRAKNKSFKKITQSFSPSVFLCVLVISLALCVTHARTRARACAPRPTHTHKHRPGRELKSSTKANWHKGSWPKKKGLRCLPRPCFCEPVRRGPLKRCQVNWRESFLRGPHDSGKLESTNFPWLTCPNNKKWEYFPYSFLTLRRVTVGEIRKPRKGIKTCPSPTCKDPSYYSSSTKVVVGKRESLVLSENPYNNLGCVYRLPMFLNQPMYIDRLICEELVWQISEKVRRCNPTLASWKERAREKDLSYEP